jgi:hypothetical protein
MLKITEVTICYYQAIKLSCAFEPESNTLAALLTRFKCYDNCIQHYWIISGDEFQLSEQKTAYAEDGTAAVL